VSELVEESRNFAVFHKAGSAGLAAGEIADKHGFGQLFALLTVKDGI
jgi:hypothetical protein